MPKNRIISFSLAILLALFLTGCGPSNDAESVDRSSMPKTSQGTPINENFDEDQVSMQDTPDSTAFSQVGYNVSKNLLVVTFRDSGASYAYYDVPQSVWNNLKSAKSMGGYYNSDVKGQYTCEKLG